MFTTAAVYNILQVTRKNYFPAQGDKITSEEIFTYIRPISDYIGCNVKRTLYRKKQKMRLSQNDVNLRQPLFY
jgi:hypothetical protein